MKLLRTATFALFAGSAVSAYAVPETLTGNTLVKRSDLDQLKSLYKEFKVSLHNSNAGSDTQEISKRADGNVPDDPTAQLISEVKSSGIIHDITTTIKNDSSLRSEAANLVKSLVNRDLLKELVNTLKDVGSAIGQPLKNILSSLVHDGLLKALVEDIVKSPGLIKALVELLRDVVVAWKNTDSGQGSLSGGSSSSSSSSNNNSNNSSGTSLGLLLPSSASNAFHRVEGLLSDLKKREALEMPQDSEIYVTKREFLDSVVGLGKDIQNSTSFQNIVKSLKNDSGLRKRDALTTVSNLVTDFKNSSIGQKLIGSLKSDVGLQKRDAIDTAFNLVSRVKNSSFFQNLVSSLKGDAGLKKRDAIDTATNLVRDVKNSGIFQSAALSLKNRLQNVDFSSVASKGLNIARDVKNTGVVQNVFHSLTNNSSLKKRDFSLSGLILSIWNSSLVQGIWHKFTLNPGHYLDIVWNALSKVFSLLGKVFKSSFFRKIVDWIYGDGSGIRGWIGRILYFLLDIFGSGGGNNGGGNNGGGNTTTAPTVTATGTQPWVTETVHTTTTAATTLRRMRRDYY